MNMLVIIAVTIAVMFIASIISYRIYIDRKADRRRQEFLARQIALKRPSQHNHINFTPKMKSMAQRNVASAPHGVSTSASSLQKRAPIPYITRQPINDLGRLKNVRLQNTPIAPKFTLQKPSQPKSKDPVHPISEQRRLVTTDALPLFDNYTPTLTLRKNRLGFAPVNQEVYNDRVERTEPKLRLDPPSPPRLEPRTKISSPVFVEATPLIEPKKTTPLRMDEPTPGLGIQMPMNSTESTPILGSSDSLNRGTPKIKRKPTQNSIQKTPGSVRKSQISVKARRDLFEKAITNATQTTKKVVRVKKIIKRPTDENIVSPKKTNEDSVDTKKRKVYDELDDDENFQWIRPGDTGKRIKMDQETIVRKRKEYFAKLGVEISTTGLPSRKDFGQIKLRDNTEVTSGRLPLTAERSQSLKRGYGLISNEHRTPLRKPLDDDELDELTIKRLSKRISFVYVDSAKKVHFSDDSTASVNGTMESTKPLFAVPETPKQSETEGKSDSKPLFGSAETSKAEAKFNFGAAVSPNAQEKSIEEKSTSLGTTESKASPPKFSFGVPAGNDGKETPKPVPDAVQEAPKLSFGTPSSTDDSKEPPKLFFGKPTSNDASKELPKLSFGASGVTTETKEPAKFSFGAPTSNDAAKEQPKLSFGASADTKEPANFTFGATPVTEAKEIPKPTVGVDASKEPPKFSFGAPATDAKKPPKFSFGAATDASKDPPKFSFGTPAATTNVSSEKDKVESKPLFGQPTTNTAVFNLNVSAPEKPVEESKAAPSAEPKPFGGFSFGSNNDTKSLFGGNTAPTASSATPADKPALGTMGSSHSMASVISNEMATTVEPPKAEAKPTFGFGNTTATPAFSFGSTDSSKPVFNFGAKPAETNIAADTKPAGFSFSAPGAANGATAFSFGTPNNAAPAFGSSAPSTNAFGQAAAAPAFGQQNTPAPATDNAANSLLMLGQAASTQQNTPAPAFGQQGQNSAPAFGQPTQTSAQVFGQPSQNPAPVFGQQTQSAPAFGGQSTQNSAPAFGQPNQNTTPFGQSAAPAFGQPAPAFGQQSQPPVQGQTTFGQPAPAFGQQTQNPSPAFGQSAQPPSFSFGPSSTPSPAFGQSAPPAFGQQSQTQPPTFGQAAPSTTPGFGQTAPTGGFTFNAAPPANSSFNFNIPGNNSVPAFKPPAPGTANRPIITPKFRRRR